MSTIRVLDEQIANQIAAGEVVERPASVVKEIVENALDAGSTRIDIALEEGGLQLIRIADNGSGIAPDELALAFLRHATSKIVSSHDLFRIATLGFRGEALPSIAAVSRVECVTADGEDGLGSRLIIEGGKVMEQNHVAAERGTTITIRDLFFNTPARLKYMKTIQTELGHISDYVYRLALSRPDVAFSLRHHGNELLATGQGGDLLQTIAAIYGSTAAKGLLQVEAETMDYRLNGYISKPEWTRANRSAISLLVNGRYIRHGGLFKAILNAYHTLLPLHRYPLAVLNIQMDPLLVDVNVHPSKLEVRFSKEQELFALIEQTLKERLSRIALIPQGISGFERKSEKPPQITEQLDLNLTRSMDVPTSQLTNAVVGEVSKKRADLPWIQASDTDDLQVEAQLDQKYAASPQRQTNNTPFANGRSGQMSGSRSGALSSYTDKQQAPALRESLAAYAQPEEQAPIEAGFPTLYPVGQVRGTYIVAQNEDGLFLIDQHAAHERIHYEDYYQKFANPAPVSQELLLPITLEFTATEAEVIRRKLPLLEQAGVYLQPFGGHTFKVSAYPYWFPAGEEQAIIEEMTEWLFADKGAIDVGKMREKTAILCSCKASIKANQSQSNDQITALLDRLGQCRNPYTCPHGRPIIVSFSNYDLEKMFKRVM